jgi:hypothetical protein
VVEPAVLAAVGREGVQVVGALAGGQNLARPHECFFVRSERAFIGDWAVHFSVSMYALFGQIDSVYLHFDTLGMRTTSASAGILPLRPYFFPVLAST